MPHESSNEATDSLMLVLGTSTKYSVIIIKKCECLKNGYNGKVRPYAKIGLAYLLQGCGSSGLQPKDAIKESNPFISSGVSVSKSTVAM